jgi:hypothetical protein
MGMVRSFATGLALIAALTLADSSWAARGGHRGGARFAGGGATTAFAVRSAPAMPVSGFPHPHHHHGRAVFFVGAPFLFYSWPYGYYYAPPPYYYGPDYAAHYDMPPLYVEKFEGNPTPQTPGDIYCPEKRAYYPDVQDCPTGWQRVIREPEARR